MSPGVVFVRAFRPSTRGESEQDAPFHDMTRLANIERYARMVSEGLRLFEGKQTEPDEDKQDAAAPSGSSELVADGIRTA